MVELRERWPILGRHEQAAAWERATLQQRLVSVRLFYDFLVEEGLRQDNPVGRGRYTPGARGGGRQRGLVRRLVKLPWIPNDEEWRAVLAIAAAEPVRTRLMLALAYDAALRREELCSLRTDDLDPGRRLVRVRAETTKSRRERVVPYSAATRFLLSQYLVHRATVSRARGGLFLAESRHNFAQPLSLWTWSKVVRRSPAYRHPHARRPHAAGAQPARHCHPAAHRRGAPRQVSTAKRS
ncbi:tyrosine-type recombinase/integrase [Streptomyces lunaelactis]|uniref:tyrosine-type recombinase/integrase n=1 Tax=Streptomyces lunaelactis TaxID=1535768 RepID=UPI0015851495|nr:tyrosine-type recombinase/integrase [Streptomyces lunaelactis]NUL01953.1 tyrosine-type recombinase/integrase [Streptomyces lunaelactis]